MAGVKGRSGRKAHLEDRSTKEIVALSAKTIIEALSPIKGSNLYELSLESRADIAKHFVLKCMPQKIEGEGFETKQFVQVYLPTTDSLETAPRTTGIISS